MVKTARQRSMKALPFKRSKQPRPSAFQYALGDCIVTSVWTFLTSFFSELTAWLSAATGANDFVVGVLLTVAALLAISPLCSFLWGAIFNPVHNAALLCSGKGDLGPTALRMVGQLSGALLGTVAAISLVPVAYQRAFHKLSGGLKDGVDLHLGFACELMLGFALNTVFLQSIDAKHPIMSFWLPLASTAVWNWLGMHFTGPSMNPFQSFSWNWHYQQHSMLEHMLVFWIAPFSGAMLAGLVHRRLTKRSAQQSASQEKKQQ